MSPASNDPFAPDRPKRRLKPLGRLIIYGGGALAVGAGGAAAFLWFWRPPAHLPRLLPADTQAVMLIRPTMRALVGVPMLRQAYPQTFDWQGLQDVRAALKRELGLTLETDVLPWITGEAGAALLPANPPGHEAGAVLGVVARDAGAAQAAIVKAALFRKQQGDHVEIKRHQGHEYRVVTSKRRPTWAFGLVGGTVAFTNAETVYHALIARARHQAPSLAGDRAFKAIDGALPHDCVVTGYLAGGRNGEALARSAVPSGPPQAQSALATWAALHGVGLGIAMRDDGMEMASLAWVDKAKLPAQARAFMEEEGQALDHRILDAAPHDTLGLMAFHFPPHLRDGLIQAWRDYRRQAPQASGGLEAAGVDMERDVLGWLTGDVALVAFPGRADPDGLPVEGYVAVRPADMGAAEAAIGRLRAAADKGLTGSPMRQTEEDTQDGRWTVLRDPGKVLGAYGRQGDEIRFVVGGHAVETLGADHPTLTTMPRFKAVERRLPRPYGAFFFMDVDAVRDFAAPLLPSAMTDVPADVKRGAAAFHAIGGAASPAEARHGLFRASLFFEITVPPEKE